MVQDALLQESIEKALESVLIGIYGRGHLKKAAGDMYPTEDPEKKADWLKRALDDESKDRREKLGLNDVMWILRKGREHGIHTAMFFITDECRYARPSIVEPEDMKAELQLAINKNMADLKDLIGRYEKLQKGK